MGLGRIKRAATAQNRRGGSGRGQREEFPADLLNILVRALGLERAALFLEDVPGRPLERVAAHGDVGLAAVQTDAAPDDGPWSAVLALGIATLKALLIVLFFMHARYSPGLTWLVIMAAVALLALLILGTMDDFLTRSWLSV